MKNKISFKKLKKELPVLLGWNIHCSERVFEVTCFEDLRTNDEALCLSSMSPKGYDYDFCLLIWGENEDLINKKIKEVLEIGRQNGMPINSATLLSQEELSKCIDYLRLGCVFV